MLGAILAYGLGFWLGADRVRALFDRVPLMKVEDFDKAEGGSGATARRRCSSDAWFRSCGASFPSPPAWHA
ncbi:hypothetical protein ACFSSF_18840 [Dietzia aerolata]|uniref:hypothetical protein n=1 Tax=Dietzia aerolata TaxID=595984 RepID=UPI003637DC58